eukprot:TRINITY_DN3182_c0_g5_i1.p2 TRINITY_DN3182_c0_g5~~TRINITY_DN3182_c0_g5_i1.p2  ORF type:complete len:234 (+),score=63.12 TRINITY_DN3182_c0_g5_i1:886-1587(+)
MAHLEGRYVAADWRMEMFLKDVKSVKQVEECTEGLIGTVQALMEKHQLKQFFFMCDIDKDNRDLSGTLKWVHEENPLPPEEFALVRQAVGEAIRRIHDVLHVVGWSALDPVIETLDNGVLGILDKMIGFHAEVFLRPPEGCHGPGGAIPSSFTQEIIDTRVEKFRHPFESNREWHLGGEEEVGPEHGPQGEEEVGPEHGPQAEEGVYLSRGQPKVFYAEVTLEGKKKYLAEVT